MKRREFLRGAAAGVLGSVGLTLAACGAPTAPPTAAPAGGATSAPAAGGATEAPAAGAATSAPAAQAPAQGSEMPAIEWRCGTSWPISLDTIYGGAVTMSERLAAMSNGMFKVTTFPAGELFPGLEVLQNVQQGTVECGHTASYYFVGLNSAFGIATALPFGLTAQQQNAWLYHGGGLEALRKVFAKFDTIQFPAGNTGAQMGGWFRKEINTPADLNGLKMRIPGLGGQVMQRLGVVTQTLPGGEIFQALQTGAIDAAEWIGPYDDQKLGLPDAAKNYYAPGWWEPGPALDFQVNIQQYEKLPTLYKEFIRTAAYEANMNMLAKYDAFNRIALQEIKDKGVTVRIYSDEIMAAAEKAAFELYNEQAASNPDFKEIFEPWQKFRTEVYGWNTTNEGAFTRYVYKSVQI